MKLMVPASLACIAILGGCSGDVGLKTGGSESGDLGDSSGAIPLATSDYVVLDIPSGELTSLREEPDLSGTSYKGQTMLFRRVDGPSGEILVAAFEVTQAQWLQMGGNDPWNDVPNAVVPTSSVTSNNPAYALSYTEVSDTLSDYQSSTGLTLGVPTAAEWSAACNAGSSDFHWGNDDSRTTVDLYALTSETADGNAGPQAVATDSANSLGMYDMHGNLWEWCSSGDELRGGSWYDSAQTARVSNALTADEAGFTVDTNHALFGARLILRP